MSFPNAVVTAPARHTTILPDQPIVVRWRSASPFFLASESLKIRVYRYNATPPDQVFVATAHNRDFEASFALPESTAGDHRSGVNVKILALCVQHLEEYAPYLFFDCI